MARWIKSALFTLAGIAFLCILLLCFVLATFDDDDYRRLAIRGVSFFTGHTITIDGPFKFELSADPYIYAEGVRVHPEENRMPPMVRKIGKLGARFAVAPMLTGRLVVRDLKVDDALMVVNLDDADSGDEDSATPGDIDLPVFESVQLRNIQLDIIDASRDRTIDVRVQELFLDDVQNAGPMFVSGKGTFSGEEFSIDGRMGALIDMLGGKTPYPVDWSVTFAGSRLTVAGTVKDFVEGEGMQLNVAGEAADLADVLKLFKIQMPPLGRLNFEATLVQDIETPGMPMVSVSLTGNPDVQFAAHGSIADVLTFEDANIDFAGACAIREIFRLFDVPYLGLLEKARVSGSLQETGGVLSLENLKLEAVSERGAAAGIEGRLELGEFVSAMSPRSMDLTLDAFFPTSDPLKPLLFERMPEIGPIVGKARLTGSIESFAFENLDVTAGGKSPLRMSSRGLIAGKVVDKEFMLSDVDLAMSVQSETTSLLASAYGADLPELGAVTATYRLAGNRDQFSVAQLQVETLTSRDLKTTWAGTIGFDRKKYEKLTGEFDLKISLTAPDLGPSTAPLGFSALPALKKVTGEANITGTTDAVSLQNITLTAGGSGPVRLDIEGAVGRIPFSEAEAVSAIDLTTTVAADTTRAFATAFGLKLTELGVVTGSCTFTGSSERLAVSDILLSTVSAGGLKIKAAGSVDRIRPGHKQPLEGADLTVTATAPRWASLPGLEDTVLPDSGPIRMDARVEDRSGGLDVESFKIISASDGPSPLTIEGQVLGLTDPKKQILEASFETSSEPWVVTYLGQPDGKNTSIQGRIKARTADGGIRIDALRLGMADGKALNVSVSGNIRTPPGTADIDLQIDARAPDPPAIGRIIGLAVPKLAPVSFEGQVRGKLSDIGLNGKVSVGKTEISTALKMAAGSARPRIDGKIFAKTVDLREMGITPEEPPQESSTIASQGSRPERLFGDKPLLPFEALKALDLSLTLDAEKLIDGDISIRNLDVDIVLENGRLTIDPFRMAYSVGYTDFDVVIDASGTVPRYEINIAGEDIAIDDLLARAHEPVIMSGSLSLLVDLRSTGRAAREVAANLNGVTSFALENGQIWRIIDLLSKDPFDILLTGVDQRKYTDVHCLISKIAFQEGTGTVDIFQMDSPRIRAKGAGKVDLKNETVELVINPQSKKSLFRRRSAVHLSGALSNPSVSTLPLSEAAELYGTIVLPFVFLPARALGYLWSLIANDQNGTPCVIEGD